MAKRAGHARGFTSAKDDAGVWVVERTDKALCGSRSKTLAEDDLTDCTACLELLDGARKAAHEECRICNGGMEGEEAFVTRGADGEITGIRNGPAETPEAPESVADEHQKLATDAARAATACIAAQQDVTWWAGIHADERLAPVWECYRRTAEEVEAELLACDKASEMVTLQANIRARRAVAAELAQPFAERYERLQAVAELAQDKLTTFRARFPLLLVDG